MIWSLRPGAFESLRQLLGLVLLLALAATSFAQPPEAPGLQMPAMGEMHQPGYEYQGCEGCGDGSCNGCDEGWAFGRRRPSICGLWGGFEAVLWWNKGRYVPALATTSNAADEGVIGRPSTNVLFGQQHIGSDPQTGGRLTVGAWLNPSQTTGVGFRFLILEGDRTGYSNTSDGTTVLARPFYNAFIGAEDSVLVGSPGFSNGTVDFRSENDFLTSEVFGRFSVATDRGRPIDLIAGYHFGRLDDSLRLTSVTNLPLPATFTLDDDFRTENEFHGGLIGAMGERCNGRTKIAWLAKISAGTMRQQSTIAGSGDVNGVPLNGAMFAQPSNIGTYTRNRFAFIPELNLNLHYAVTERIDVSVGYSVIYLSSVALAGDQLDRRINFNQPGPPLLPDDTFQVTDFWYQGLNFGLNWNF